MYYILFFALVNTSFLPIKNHTHAVQKIQDNINIHETHKRRSNMFFYVFIFAYNFRGWGIVFYFPHNDILKGYFSFLASSVVFHFFVSEIATFDGF